MIIEELTKIRKLLEPGPTPPPPKGFRAEFRDFLSKYKVMGMAVAFIFGIYLGGLVQALVNDLIMPIVQIAMPKTNWQTIAVGPFQIGAFAGALLTFIIIALVIFMMVKLTSKVNIQ